MAKGTTPIASESGVVIASAIPACDRARADVGTVSVYGLRYWSKARL